MLTTQVQYDLLLYGRFCPMELELAILQRLVDNPQHLGFETGNLIMVNRASVVA